jgi:aldehyde:ferredoxin oxidoreductase
MKSRSNSFGYCGKILRVDLTAEKITEEVVDEDVLRLFLGGTGLGAKYLYDEVPPGVGWADPENRLIIASGTLGGTRVPGSGTFSAVAKGALTEGATATQANGFLGTFLRFNGFDGLIVEGASKDLVYLYIREGEAEIRDAGQLAGKDTTETEDEIKKVLGLKEHMLSVFCIGPAGENLVRYACIAGDKGHVAAHNGIGAVMGSKGLKAIVAHRGKDRVEMKDDKRFSELSKILLDRITKDPKYYGPGIRDWGTLNIFKAITSMGSLLQKNYTTNEYEKDEFSKFCGEYIRSRCETDLHACWACPMKHCHTLRIPDGPYAGTVIEEPEYEGLASWSTQIGQTDVTEAMILSDMVDRLGMDTNESSWVIGMVMECLEKGEINKEDLDGLELNWGNVDAVKAMLHKIATRQGFGDVLAEGAMRAAQRIGGRAPEFAIHTMKGNTPRSHDHRLNWREMFDTCVSNTGTLESGWQIARPNFDEIGLKPIMDPFSPMEVSTYVAKAKGVLLFEDSLGTCTFCTQGSIKLLSDLVNAATGWEFGVEDALKTGHRIANLLNIFNLRHGITADRNAPSTRYGSTPVDGPHEGDGIAPVWNDMLRNYYEQMGWDPETGTPLPQTLKDLGLEHVLKDIP